MSDWYHGRETIPYDYGDDEFPDKRGTCLPVSEHQLLVPLPGLGAKIVCPAGPEDEVSGCIQGTPEDDGSCWLETWWEAEGWAMVAEGPEVLVLVGLAEVNAYPDLALRIASFDGAIVKRDDDGHQG